MSDDGPPDPTKQTINVKLYGAMRRVLTKDFKDLAGLQKAIFDKFQLGGGDLEPDALRVFYIDDDDKEIMVDYESDFEIMAEVL